MTPAPPRPRWTRLVLPAALALVALAYADTLRYGLAADARFLIAENRFLDGWRWLVPTLTHDFFWSSSGASIPYWRPLTKLSWLVEARLSGRAPAMFHAVQLAWLLAAVAALYALARRLGGSAATAGVAALVFGLHPTLVEPVCLVMARSDVAALACTLGSLAAWHWWQEGGRRAGAWLHLAALALALASKESAVIIPLVVSIWALLAPGARRRRLLSTLPAWLLLAVYLALRGLALAAPPPGPSLDAARLAGGLMVYGRALLPLQLGSGVRNLAVAEAAAARTLVVALLVVAAAAGTLAWALATRRRWALQLWVLALAALAPALVGPAPYIPGVAGKYAYADRWIIVAAAASSAGLVLLFAELPALVRRVALVALALWALAALATSRAAHSYYYDDEALLALQDQMYADTPAQYRTVEDACRAHQRQIARALVDGRVDHVVQLTRRLPAGCARDAPMRFNQLAALVYAYRYVEARPVAEELLAQLTLEPGSFAAAHFLAGIALLKTGEPARAEKLLLASAREGLRACVLWERLSEAATALGHPTEAAARHAQARACLVTRP